MKPSTWQLLEWASLPSPLSPLEPPALGKHVVQAHTHTRACAHTEPVLLGNLQFAFENDHPLWFSAAVHVKTALNLSRNCWHTSVDVSPSTLCAIPRGRNKVLPPSPPLGAMREKLVAVHTSHPCTHCCWPLYPYASCFVNVTSPPHPPPYPAC